MTQIATHITPAPDWRVTQEKDRYHLQFMEPARLTWFCLHESRSLVEVENAYLALQEGEQPEHDGVDWP